MTQTRITGELHFRDVISARRYYAPVLSHSNAISVVCFVVNLALKTSGINHLPFKTVCRHNIREFYAISQDGLFIYFSFKNLDRFFTFSSNML